MHFATRLSKLAFPFLHANGYLRYTDLDAPQEYSIPSPAHLQRHWESAQRMEVLVFVRWQHMNWDE